MASKRILAYPPDMSRVTGAGGRVVAGGVAIVVSILLGAAACAHAPSADETLIRQARADQNDAIREGDFDRIASHWVEDIVVTAGLGFVLSGRDPYRAAFAADSALVYVRTTERVHVSDAWPLARESGTWVGLDDGRPLIRGSYAAQWVRVDGTWLIRSELFVADECEGRACAWAVVR